VAMTKKQIYKRFMKRHPHYWQHYYTLHPNRWKKYYKPGVGYVKVKKEAKNDSRKDERISEEVG